MTDELVRRGVLRGLAVVGIAGLGGCNFGDSTGGGLDGDGGGGGGSDGETPTPEPLTWSEATREVLEESDLELLRGTDSAPETIGSRSDAERAFTIVGWHRSIQSLDADGNRQINELLRRGPEVERRISETESSLREMESLITEMKNTDIPLTGQTVWDSAVALVPSLQGFDVAVQEGLDELRTWQRLLGEVTTSLERINQTVSAVRAGEVEKATDLDGQTRRAVSAIDNLESRSSDLRRTLSEYATVTGQVANVAGDLGPLAGEVGTVYGEASRRLDRAASELREFNGLLRGARSAVGTMRSDAQDTASRLLARAEDLVGPGATREESGESTPEPDTPTQTPTPTQIPENPRSNPEFREGFEDGPGDWRGDTDAVEHTTDAARGSGAVRLAAGHTRVYFDVPETSRETYSFWWKVTDESGGLRVTFDGDGSALFGMEVRDGPGGPELVVNPESAGDASDLLYGQVRTDTWYNLTVTGVDFGSEEFEAALFDIGDLELVRTRQVFAGDGEAVSSLSVRNTGDGPVFFDDLRIS